MLPMRVETDGSLWVALSTATGKLPPVSPADPAAESGPLDALNWGEDSLPLQFEVGFLMAAITGVRGQGPGLKCKLAAFI